MTFAHAEGGAQSEVTFERAWGIADTIAGWLTLEQGRLLWDSVMATPVGSTIVEIGSHKGRSTVILGLAAQTRGSRVVAIDPFVDGAMFGGTATRSVFEANVSRAGLEDVVDLMAMPSRAARGDWQAQIALLYIDGKHDYWTVVDDLRWARYLAPHARVLIHDSFCSVGVTSALIDRVLVRGEMRYLGREGTMAVFDLATTGRGERQEMLRQMPWFARNVVIKAARRTRATPVLRALKHDSPVDPY